MKRASMRSATRILKQLVVTILLTLPMLAAQPVKKPLKAQTFVFEFAGYDQSSAFGQVSLIGRNFSGTAGHETSSSPWVDMFHEFLPGETVTPTSTQFAPSCCGFMTIDNKEFLWDGGEGDFPPVRTNIGQIISKECFAFPQIVSQVDTEWTVQVKATLANLDGRRDFWILYYPVDFQHSTTRRLEINTQGDLTLTYRYHVAENNFTFVRGMFLTRAKK